MTSHRSRAFASAVAMLAVAGFAASASAAPRHHNAGVTYSKSSSHSGYQPLVSDGQGTGFGFHRLPLPYSVAAIHERDRQSEAVHDAVVSSAVGSQPRFYSLPGDSVYGYGNGASYGVFNGSDGYGSPYFAGYYGPADGEDYGPFGHAYTN